MTSVAILGSGAVGVACAGPLLQLGLASQLTLYDRDGERARGEALDFQHAAPLLPECAVESGSMDSIRAADIAVLAAGEHTQPGQTRLDTLDHNLAVTTEVADALEQALPRVVIVVSNPLDVLTEYLDATMGVPPSASLRHRHLARLVAAPRAAGSRARGTSRQRSRLGDR